MINLTELEQRRLQLQKQLAAVDRQIVTEQKEAWIANEASKDERRLMARFSAGDYVINSSGRCWWVNGGNLKEMTLPSEMAALVNLVKAGIIQRCEWSEIVKP